MYSVKISPQVQLALKYQNLLLPETFKAITGNSLSGEQWEVLVRHLGAIEEIKNDLPIEIEVISGDYAIIYINKDDIIALAEYPNIIYIEFPEVMEYILDSALASTCTIPVISERGKFKLTGMGSLIAVIDSGIDYSHPDFIDENGDSRIAYLWDQTIKGTPPDTFSRGTEYNKEQITAAIKAPTEEAREKMVPSKDVLGHGTAIAGIAGGNGRGSNRKYLGMAPKSEFIIVKVGSDGVGPDSSTAPKNTEIMLGARYAVEKAILLEKPISIVVGFGVNEGAHTGRSSLELFLAAVGLTWKTNVSVGTGNQANKDSHTQGVVEEGGQKTIQIYIAPDQPYFFFTLWTGFTNRFGLEIQAPTGEKTEILQDIVNNRAFIFGNTAVLVNFSEPSIAGLDSQIIVFLESTDGTSINSGIWDITLSGLDVTDGKYNIWGSNPNPNSRDTRFIQPTTEITLTIPSTTELVTSVAAYNNLTNQIAPFSGRGYTRNDRVKPDITAPGVDIMAPTARNVSDTPGNLYAPVSGTSASAAFVAGAYALLMEYGMVQQGDPYLYGERLKSYVLRNTKELPNEGPFPNNKWGYGVLCVEKVVIDLQQKYAQSN